MAKIGRIHGIGSELPHEKRKRVPLLPNPSPQDIFSLVAVVVSMPGLAFSLYRAIKLWIEYQNAKQIRIKKGEFEVEIKGGMSAKEIRATLSLFRKVAKIKEKREVEVSIPKNCDPDLSLELFRESRK